MLSGGVNRTVSCADGVELSLVEAGEEGCPVLVFIHGYPDTKELWEPVLERLSGTYHVIAYDVRGAGASSAPRRRAAYDLERLADDLEAVLETAAPGRGVHLVGHDWGALQGWEFVTLERFRGRLRSFTAIAGPPLDDAARSSRLRPSPAGVRRTARSLRRSWYVLALLTPGVPTLVWRGALAAGRWRRLLRALERIPDPCESPTLARDGIYGANLYRRNVPRRLLRPRTQAVAHVPVQAIVPTEDRFIPRHYYDGIDRRAPILWRRAIGTTHWAPRTSPGLLARWIAEFVEEVETGAPRSIGDPRLGAGGRARAAPRPDTALRTSSSTTPGSASRERSSMPSSPTGGGSSPSS